MSFKEKVLYIALVVADKQHSMAKLLTWVHFFSFLAYLMAKCDKSEVAEPLFQFFFGLTVLSVANYLGFCCINALFNIWAFQAKEGNDQ